MVSRSARYSSISRAVMCLPLSFRLGGADNVSEPRNGRRQAPHCGTGLRGNRQTRLAPSGLSVRLSPISCYNFVTQAVDLLGRGADFVNRTSTYLDGPLRPRPADGRRFGRRPPMQRTRKSTAKSSSPQPSASPPPSSTRRVDSSSRRTTTLPVPASVALAREMADNDRSTLQGRRERRPRSGSPGGGRHRLQPRHQ